MGGTGESGRREKRREAAAQLSREGPEKVGGEGNIGELPPRIIGRDRGSGRREKRRSQPPGITGHEVGKKRKEKERKRGLL